jgi:hypothetical protein
MENSPVLSSSCRLLATEGNWKSIKAREPALNLSIEGGEYRVQGRSFSATGRSHDSEERVDCEISSTCWQSVSGL